MTLFPDDPDRPPPTLPTSKKCPFPRTTLLLVFCSPSRPSTPGLRHFPLHVDPHSSTIPLVHSTALTPTFLPRPRREPFGGVCTYSDHLLIPVETLRLSRAPPPTVGCLTPLVLDGFFRLPSPS